MTLVARIVSTVFSPTLVIGILCPLVAGLAERTLVGVFWGVLEATFTAAIPAAVVHGGVLTGRWGDHHISQRERRIVPLVSAVASVTVGLVLLMLLDAPRTVVALEVVILVILMATTATTLVWKISIHTTVIAASAATLTVVGGRWWGLVWTALPAVAWARLRMAAHTVEQLIAGAILGGGVGLAIISHSAL